MTHPASRRLLVSTFTVLGLTLALAIAGAPARADAPTRRRSAPFASFCQGWGDEYGKRT
jgi:hypothetical protein